MDAMQIANGPVLWIACAIPVIFTVFQAILFAKGSYSAGKKIGLTDDQMKRAMKSSAISSIGPSVVVLSGMLSLLVSVGGPIGWMRLSMIGSVMFESIAAGIGTASVGVTLGSDTMTTEALAMAIWTMILCSIGWVLFGTFSANRMDKIQNKISRGNTNTLTAIASAAIIGCFSAMCANYLSKPLYNIILSAESATITANAKGALSCILGAIIMFILTTIANKKKIGWLREWSLTITMLGAMIITSLV